MKSIMLKLGGRACHTLRQGGPASALLWVSLVCCGPLLPACENQETAKQINSLRARADQVEKQLAPLKALEQRLVALEGQADRLDRSLSEIKEQNKILEGHVTRLVHAAEQGRRKPVALAPVPAEKNRPAPGKSSALPTPQLHTVQQGDTIYSIARTHGLSVEELCRLNGLSRQSRIFLGQRLTIMPAKKAAEPEPKLQQ